MNPIPSTGLDPVADTCDLVLSCIYDEPIFQPISSSTRWYALLQPTELFLITREPVSIEQLRKIDVNSAGG